MKNKLVLLVLSFAIVLASCKKDNNKDNAPGPETTATIKQKLVGNWQLMKGVGTVYDETGKVVKTEEEKAETTSMWKFLDDNTLENNDTKSTRNYQYNLTNANNKIYINLISTFTDTYEIAIDGSTMTWVIEATSSNSNQARVRQVYYFDRK